jgi:copper chaperone CopZ
MEEVTVKISGMNCNHCKMNVESQLRKIQGIRAAVADILTGKVTITGDRIDLGKVKAAIENIGYSFGGKVT